MARGGDVKDLGFALSQEDERTEATVFGPPGEHEILCVASGGEVPLGLAARGYRVVAVDRSPAQLFLVRLKLAAALHLEPADAAALLGYAAATTATRRALWTGLAPRLSPEDRAAWEAEPGALRRGPALWGRFERYVGAFLTPARWLWGHAALDALCGAPDLATQAGLYDAHIDRPWLRLAFWFAFNPFLYRRGGLDQRALAQRADPRPLAVQYQASFRGWCCDTPAPDNWFLHVFLRGALLDPLRGPDWLRPEGVAALRAHPERLRLVEGDLPAFVAGLPQASLGAAHLSNLGDWLDAPAFEALLASLARALTPGAPFCWRELQVRRDLPEALAGRLSVDRAEGERLRARDRYPFYRIVPGRRVG